MIQVKIQTPFSYQNLLPKTIQVGPAKILQIFAGKLEVPRCHFLRRSVSDQFTSKSLNTRKFHPVFHQYGAQNNAVNKALADGLCRSVV